MEKQDISCPNCGHHFNVEDVFYKEIELAEKQKYQQQLQKVKRSYKDKEENLQKREEQLEEKRKRANDLFQERVNKELAALRKEEAKKASEAVAFKLDALEKETKDKSVLVLELQKKEVEFLQQQKLMNEERERREIELQKKLLEQQMK